jgi:hypothetical protein
MNLQVLLNLFEFFSLIPHKGTLIFAEKALSLDQQFNRRSGHGPQQPNVQGIGLETTALSIMLEGMSDDLNRVCPIYQTCIS